ncbi:MAG: BON domain-containing protein [Solirubrobacterales bacterium]
MAVLTQTDEQIKKAIVDELYWDERVDAADVKVEVRDGHVFLSGTVPTNNARTAAEDDARAVSGGGELDNDLTVKFPTHMQIPSDDELEANVMSALRWYAEFDASNIEAEAEGGWVTLRGEVETYWQKLRAEDIVQPMTGVAGVTNELAVVPSGDFEDRRIAEEIEAALERNVYVEAGKVEVKVDHGVVTLMGVVSDVNGFRAARDAARYTRGVVDIDNRLTVG